MTTWRTFGGLPANLAKNKPRITKTRGVCTLSFELHVFVENGELRSPVSIARTHEAKSTAL